MTDLEMIAESLAEPEALRVEMDGAQYRRLLTLAETGALLAEVEQRYPDVQIDRDEGNIEGLWVAGVPAKTTDHSASDPSGSGPTLTAALRDLLGVDGG